MIARSRMHLRAITSHDHGGKTLHFEAVLADEIPEDMRFRPSVPLASIEVLAENSRVIGQFIVGADYYIDFAPANSE